MNPEVPLFSAYEALDKVLLSFDRLAILCDKPQAMNKFIKKYKPPLHDLKDILQALIAVRIVLAKENGNPNYKKDYMLLLRMLHLADRCLYETCKKGLQQRGEWSIRDSFWGWRWNINSRFIIWINKKLSGNWQDQHFPHSQE